MDYNRIYDQIIARSIDRTVDQYVERHHIVPKCLGGTNQKNNIAVLTYREHFICHWLLCKMHPSNHKLKSAFAKMLESNKNNGRIVSANRFYIVKRSLKDVKYPWLVGLEPWNKGKKNVQVPWNKGLKCENMSSEQKIRISETLKLRYVTHTHHRKNVEPWNKGKKNVQVPWNAGIKMPQTACPHCNKMVDTLNMKRWHGDNCKIRLVMQNGDAAGS